MLLMILVAIVVVGVVMFYASYSIRMSPYVSSFCRAQRDDLFVALTFDDGPDPVITPKVLDVLQRNGVKATFFLVGERAQSHPSIVERIVAQGHEIGNHTTSHTWRFPFKNSRQMRDDINTCSDILKRITGCDVTLFRPAYGVTNPMLSKALRGLELSSTGWSIRSLDTNLKTPRQAVAQKISRKLRPGAVILLHDNRPDADVLLQMILSELNKKQYKTLTISQIKQ